jgi:hypothetical protein|tara:strand:+ start:1383 stop:3164 length:1782 start_codon:yes stop_codon:yes gene_type:complete
MSVLEKLTEGIVNRDLQKEGAALLDKWERTGLLEGITNDANKNGMARLLENQAKELLRETSAMVRGDVEGFASVAFPLVRRVFGSLIANDLVSVQPMSLPSGLIFFLDFTFNESKLGARADNSLYGGGVVGNQLTGGVTLDSFTSEESFYSLNQGYASPTGSFVVDLVAAATVLGAGYVGEDSTTDIGTTANLMNLVQWDPDLSGSDVVVVQLTGSGDINSQMNLDDFVAISTTGSLAAGRLVRRLTQFTTASTQTGDNQLATWGIQMVFQASSGTGTGGSSNGLWGANTGLVHELTAANAYPGFDCPITDNFVNATGRSAQDAVGALVGADTWGLENQGAIPQIDIKVDSVSVTAITKKLKAQWTPELGQDLNAYHNLDAEVELTGILSEQIALEIDREILEDLVKGATAGTLYWSRNAGKFVNRETGAEIGATTVTPDFTGTVSEWYETLCETINDVSARIHRRTLRGGANFIVCGPEVANILEFTSGFRADVTGDGDRGSVGAVRTGSLSKKWDIYVDPYFVRNVVLVGRRGGSFLESGYVYAPYVPLQVTPTIFGIDDFVPRKGVMTRYAKKMVRPDMYGLVIVEDLVG